MVRITFCDGGVRARQLQLWCVRRAARERERGCVARGEAQDAPHDRRNSQEIGTDPSLPVSVNRSVSSYWRSPTPWRCAAGAVHPGLELMPQSAASCGSAGATASGTSVRQRQPSRSAL